jgi:hypothetical protein
MQHLYRGDGRLRRQRFEPFGAPERTQYGNDSFERGSLAAFEVRERADRYVRDRGEPSLIEVTCDPQCSDLLADQCLPLLDCSMVAIYSHISLFYATFVLLHADKLI